MSAASFALVPFQGFDPLDIIIFIVALPLLGVFWVVNLMRELVGCELTGFWIVLFALYAGYHAWVETFDEKAMLIWLTSASGMVLLVLQCEGDLFDVAMLMQEAPRLVKDLKNRF